VHGEPTATERYRQVEALFSSWNAFTSVQTSFDPVASEAFLTQHVNQFYSDDIIDQVSP
jgi:hypothetical protein